jgi:hypothetical protein
MAKSKLTLEVVIDKFQQIHGEKYDYSNVVYVSYHTPVEVICQSCQRCFFPSPANHISRSSGCPLCATVGKHQHAPKRLASFVEQANATHNRAYEYSLVRYVNTHTKVDITCPTHGVFTQSPVKHLMGNGCPMCRTKSTGEIWTSTLLNDMNVVYITEHTFDNCVNPLTGMCLKYDFFIPELNMLLEFDGVQHRKPCRFGGMSLELAERKYAECIERDNIKNDFAKQNGIHLLRITNKGVKTKKMIIETINKQQGILLV